MPRRDGEDVARRELVLGAVAHPHGGPSGQHEAHVLDLAERLGGGGAHLLGPDPPRLVSPRARPSGQRLRAIRARPQVRAGAEAAGGETGGWPRSHACARRNTRCVSTPAASAGFSDLEELPLQDDLRRRCLPYPIEGCLVLSEECVSPRACSVVRRDFCTVSVGQIGGMPRNCPIHDHNAGSRNASVVSEFNRPALETPN